MCYKILSRLTFPWKFGLGNHLRSFPTCFFLWAFLDHVVREEIKEKFLFWKQFCSLTLSALSGPQNFKRMWTEPYICISTFFTLLQFSAWVVKRVWKCKVSEEAILKAFLEWNWGDFVLESIPGKIWCSCRSKARLPSKANIQRVVSCENKIISKKVTVVEIKMVLQNNISDVKTDCMLVFFPCRRKEQWLKQS